MLTRLLITLILLFLGSAIFLILRHAHSRRASWRQSPAGQHEGSPTLLYFHSDKCAPCVTQGHYLELLEDTYEGEFIMKTIDADDEPQTANDYGVFSLPSTFVLDRSGKVRQINYGLTTAHKLKRQIESVL